VPPDGVLVVSSSPEYMIGMAVKCNFQPFSERAALGQYWLKDLDNGAYRQESYVAHISMPSPRVAVYWYHLRQMIDLPGGDGVALLTAGRVVTFGTKRLRLKWDLPLTQVQRVINEDQGIQFAHKVGREHDKYLIIEDKRSQAWFYEQIAGVVKSFNARRRMDS
jgi:vacuolar protein sorting-associated protein 13A/C